ncbi:hypothetical protein [Spiroplasma endosymbiont of Notiophilus biguttatus]|uniref:hypothetical protein n=1 Tax=Spiroplasma endosymbiont of Notiophilus biguttatus TaxID=3066285 RepID=UPI00313E2502
MAKIKTDGKKWKNNFIKIIKNKTFIKCCKYNSIILILGTSLILNIIYIPKFLNGTTNQNSIATNIEITAINRKETILEKTNYITTFNTLGNLLSACSNDFTVEKSQFGRFLVAVKGKKGTQKDKKFWYIEHWNGKEFIDFSVGIDDIKLENNEIFQFELK